MASSSKVINVIGKDVSGTLSIRRLVQWINNIVQANIKRIDELRSGAAYCQLIHLLFPQSISLKRVKFHAQFEYEYFHNFKVLQTAFDALDIMKNVPVNDLIRGRGHQEFLAWYNKFYIANSKNSSNDPVVACHEDGVRNGQPVSTKRTNTLISKRSAIVSTCSTSSSLSASCPTRSVSMLSDTMLSDTNDTTRKSNDSFENNIQRESRVQDRKALKEHSEGLNIDKSESSLSARHCNAKFCIETAYVVCHEAGVPNGKPACKNVSQNNSNSSFKNESSIISKKPAIYSICSVSNSDTHDTTRGSNESLVNNIQRESRLQNRKASKEHSDSLNIVTRESSLSATRCMAKFCVEADLQVPTISASLTDTSKYDTAHNPHHILYSNRGRNIPKEAITPGNHTLGELCEVIKMLENQIGQLKQKADDSKSTRSYLEYILKEVGVACEMVHSEQSALAAVEKIKVILSTR